MNTYRKKPVLIEAAQYDGTSFSAESLAAWCGGYVSLIGAPERQVIYIETLEGRMMADVHDYIIKGVQGEFYPCKPDIFEATYEYVEDH